MVVSAEQAAEVFPAVRYFQIHFEFLQEQLQLIARNQETLQQQIQQLEARLSAVGQTEQLSNQSEGLTASGGAGLSSFPRRQESRPRSQ